MKVNYFSLFLKAIVFALICLALKTFFNSVARADDFALCDKIKDVSGYLQCVTNELATDRENARIQRQQHIKESYKETQDGPIAKYTKEHYAEAPLYSPEFVYAPSNTYNPHLWRNDHANHTGAPIPVYEIQTGIPNTTLIHPIDNPFTTPQVIYTIKRD